MKITIKKDGDGYLAQVVGTEFENLYAWAETKQEAYQELFNVVDMIMDIELEKVEKQRQVKTFLQKKYRTAHAL